MRQVIKVFDVEEGSTPEGRYQILIRLGSVIVDNILCDTMFGAFDELERRGYKQYLDFVSGWNCQRLQPCEFSDAWRCAQAKRLCGQIACWCSCHQYLDVPPPPCRHERTDEDGICRTCGADRRGIQ